jgi:excinuclease ABC subunit A
MQFMADIQLPCGECRGKRFQPHILDIQYRNKSIADVLEMSADQAEAFFRGEKKLLKKLQPLRDIGLGYLPIGQSLSTLSAGEMMRLKLASYLDDPSGSLIVMDEPTTGLHFQDVKLLLDVLQKLVDKGNTVLIIEHNLDVVKVSDYVIDMGPEGGNAGGQLVASGTPEEICKVKGSETGRFLMKEMK